MSREDEKVSRCTEGVTYRSRGVLLSEGGLQSTECDLIREVSSFQSMLCAEFNGVVT